MSHNRKNSWKSAFPNKIGSIQYHEKLLEKGVLLVKPPGVSRPDIDNNSFPVGEKRQFQFSTFSKIKQKLSDQQQLANRPSLKGFHKAYALYESLTKTAKIPCPEIVDALVNSKRREEIFFPYLIPKEGKDKNFGMYIYAWSKKAKEQQNFNDIEEFVTAGCMFASNMKAKDQYDCDKPIIKHQIDLHDGQKFEQIDYDPHSANPYETMLFKEFNKITHLIDRLAVSNQAKKLTYHVPYYDYMLFGVELFINGRITLSALGDFFIHIIDKADDYTQKLKRRCEKHKINLNVISPFDNLFGPLNDIKQFVKNKVIEKSELLKLPLGEEIGNNFFYQLNFLNTNTDIGNPAEDIKIALAKNILTSLGLPTDERDPCKINEQDKNEQEKKLVKLCLEKLQTNTHNEKQREVWSDFIAKTVSKNITISNLEDLFKIANAVVVGTVSKNKKDYQVSSILPLSEKQIQISYDSYCDKQYPATLNLTTMESLLPYSAKNNGILFYYNQSKEANEAINKLISEQKKAKTAAENISFFYKNKENLMTPIPAEPSKSIPKLRTSCK